MTPILTTEESRMFLKSYRPPERRMAHYTWADSFVMTPERLDRVANKLNYYEQWYLGMTEDEQKDEIGQWVASNILMYTFILNENKQAA